MKRKLKTSVTSTSRINLNVNSNSNFNSNSNLNRNLNLINQNEYGNAKRNVVENMEINLNSNIIELNQNSNSTQPENLSEISVRRIKPTRSFKSYKIHCNGSPRDSEHSNNSHKKKKYEICLIDSPGYSESFDEDQKEKWLKDMIKYIGNRVRRRKSFYPFFYKFNFFSKFFINL